MAHERWEDGPVLNVLGECKECEVPVVTKWSWRRLRQERRDELRGMYHEHGGHGLCKNCYARANRRSRATGGPRSPSWPAELAYDEYMRVHDPEVSQAENCRVIAPRLGMSWTALERAVVRAKSRQAAA